MCGRAPPHPLTASTRSPPPIHPLTCRLLHPSSLHLRVRPTPRHTPPLHQYILVLLSPLFSQHFSPLLILPPPDSHSASLPFFPVFQSLIFPTHTHTHPAALWGCCCYAIQFPCVLMWSLRNISYSSEILMSSRKETTKGQQSRGNKTKSHEVEASVGTQGWLWTSQSGPTVLFV